MLIFPMVFMMLVTISSLIINTKNQFSAIAAGGADWGPWVQAIIGILLIVLALALAVEGYGVITGKGKTQKEVEQVEA